MCSLQAGIEVIESYPFRKGTFVVDVLGKPIDWRTVIQNVGDKFDVLASHVFNMGEKGEKHIVCPIPNHKTEITSSKKLSVLTAKEGQAALYRGSYADGAVVERGEVYALASADCPTVSIHDPKSSTTVVVHFSRQSGVVGGILANALVHFSDSIRTRLLAAVSLGIDTEHFLHRWDNPTYGETNKKLTETLIRTFGKDSVSRDKTLGGINLRYIAIQKLIEGGLRPGNIYVDEIDTYSDSQFWSQRASTEFGTKRGDTGRNLVLVANLN